LEGNAERLNVVLHCGCCCRLFRTLLDRHLQAKRKTACDSTSRYKSTTRARYDEEKGGGEPHSGEYT
jgi:hypothetical protein